MSTSDDRAKAMLRSNVAVALGTGLSRVTGLVRVLALASAIGKQRLSDTYNLANNTPNVVYELLLGGVLTASLVPMFVQQHEDDDADGTDAIVSVALIVLLAITVAAVLCAPLLIQLLTLQAEGDVAQMRAVGTRLARLFLPQMFFYGITALATSLLNARRRFMAPAFTPVFNNLLVIAVVLSAPTLISGPLDIDSAATSSSIVWLLGLGTTAGVALTAIALLPALSRSGVTIRWNPDFRHPAVKRVLTMSGWTLGYVAANQVAWSVITILANRHEGDYTAYTYAFTLFVLPHGLLAVSLMTTFAPELASSAHHGNFARFRSQMNLGMRALGLLVIPASVGFMTLGKPLASIMFRRGEFSADDALLTGKVLIAFAAGLFGFSAYLFVLRGFYAMRDAKTPFILNIGENAVNVILAVAFVERWGAIGLAASYGIAYLASAALAYAVLVQRVGRLGGLMLPLTLVRYVVAAAVMALVITTLTSQLSGAWTKTIVGVVVGAIVYFGVVIISHPVSKGMLAGVQHRATVEDRSF